MIFCRYLTIIYLLILTGCTQVLPHANKPTQDNEQPFTLPASAYLALATNQQGSEKQSLLLLAAGRLIYDGQWRQGAIILNQTSSLPPKLQDIKYLLQAKIFIINAEHKQALATLAKMNGITQLPLYYQAQFHELLATTYQAIGQPVSAVSERIKLHALLEDPSSIANNARALWFSLTTLPVAELETLSIETKHDPLLNGWITLANLARKPISHAADWLAAIQHWQEMNPNHPAATILPTSLASLQPELFDTPQHIALLLPLSGPLAGPGEAIHDGFMAAASVSSVDVRVYDTNSAPIVELYNQAIKDGAEYIVGPLSKPDVAAIADIKHPVPTLLLNDINTRIAPRAYTFGLSPQNEARLVASRAGRQGLHDALVIAPEGIWGDDVVQAFANQWSQSGGKIIDTMRYNQHTDLQAAIRQLLQINSSEARGRDIKRLLGDKLETITGRRLDFDMIFLVAYPSKARQIMPLLRYYYVQNVPVYATSSVYSGSINTTLDRDLNGIIFCDMPWLFTHQMGARQWPEQLNSYNRLYAIGMDSYALASQLNSLLLFPALGIRDQSGVLYMAPNQHIERILVFGQFQQGVARNYSVF